MEASGCLIPSETAIRSENQGNLYQCQELSIYQLPTRSPQSHLLLRRALKPLQSWWHSRSCLSLSLASVQAPKVGWFVCFVLFCLSAWFALLGETRSCYIVLYDPKPAAILPASPNAHNQLRIQNLGKCEFCVVLCWGLLHRLNSQKRQTGRRRKKRLREQADMRLQ